MEIDEEEEKAYRVFIDDNFHYMDEEYRTFYGKFDTCEEATRVCMYFVNESLRDLYQPGMTAEALFQRYRDFGEDPFIRSSDQPCRFSAWTYAKERCAEICG